MKIQLVCQEQWEESLYWIDNQLSVEWHVSDVGIQILSAMLDGGSTGYGLYTFEISVDLLTLVRLELG